MYDFEFSVIGDNLDVFWRGTLLTLEISTISMVLGLLAALIVLLARMSTIRAIRYFARAYIEVVRNTPFLLQLFFIFFGLPTLGVFMSPNLAAILALSLNGSAYIAEIMRGGLLSIDKGQREAGFALGLNGFQIFRYVVMKPMLRAVYPSLTSQFVLLMLTSSVVASISADELTSLAQALDSVTFRSFEIYFFVTAIYLALSLTLMQIFKHAQRLLFAYPTK